MARRRKKSSRMNGLGKSTARRCRYGQRADGRCRKTRRRR